MESKISILNHINKILKSRFIEPMTLNNLNIIILDISRILDKRITQKINLIKRDQGVNLNSNQRKNIRKILLGYPNFRNYSLDKYKIQISGKILSKGYKCLIYGSKKQSITDNTIISRYKLYFLRKRNNILQKYLRYIKNIQSNKYQLMYLNISADDKYNSDDINYFIKNEYSKLSNYHNCIITFKDTKKNKIRWDMIAKVAIYMENFLIEEKFNIFQKYNQFPRINDLNKFIDRNPNVVNSNNLISIIKRFYRGVSYGFQFVDLFVSKDASTKSLIMKKVKLNELPCRCPVCFHRNARSNSYSKILFKNFECKNPNCLAKSKSNRGKRFDSLSAKRQIMLRRNDVNDYINDDIYKCMRRDIVKKK